MQIELIAPVSVSSASLPRLGLGILAALTPPDDEVIYTDEVVKPFDLGRDVKDVDLFGISVDSKTARRSYDIADAYRRRGVPVVVGGIHPTACPADDNVMIHRGYARELFTRMIPRRKQWIGQCSLAAVRSLENVRLMAESGCKALLVGFESVDEATTRATGKKQNRPAEYRDTVQMLREHGIAVWGSFVFGFDTDDVEVFDRTVELAIAMRLTTANFSILCPYPGTALYRRLAAEGRLTDPHWWLREYREEEGPHFVPKRLTPEQLREGWMRAARRFFSYASMWQRWEVPPASGWIQRVAFWPLNLMQRRMAIRREAAVAAGR